MAIILCTPFLRNNKMDLLKSCGHPEEIAALLRFKLGGSAVVMPKCDFANMSPSLRECYDLLTKTSRSFAAVIQALDGSLRDAVCIFYLVLRALDTVEDDMTIPNAAKVPMLVSFHENLLDENWQYSESKDKDRIVLEKFPIISKEFRALPPRFRTIISEICQKMGAGMTVFLEKKIETMDDYDEYCHYVAGLVGMGLARLFSASGLEDAIVGDDQELANQVGTFMHRMHVIKDFFEDWTENRTFWPRAIWGKYANDIGHFVRPENRQNALECLNDLIANAMELVPASILFMSRLRNQSVFNFVAIPQVISLATLERCHNNPEVFTGVIKIRKGEAARLMLGATSFEKVKAIMRHYTNDIINKIPQEDPTAQHMLKVCEKALAVTQSTQDYSTSSIYPPLYVSMGLMLSAIAYNYWSQIWQFYDDLLQ